MGASSDNGVRAVKKLVVRKGPQYQQDTQRTVNVGDRTVHTGAIDSLVIIKPGSDIILPDDYNKKSIVIGPKPIDRRGFFGSRQTPIVRFDIGSCIVVECDDDDGVKRLCWICVDDVTTE